MPLLEQREVGFADADGGREILGLHLAPRQHHVEIDPDRHQTKPSLSAFRATASLRMRAIARTHTNSRHTGSNAMKLRSQSAEERSVGKDWGCTCYIRRSA